MWPEGSFPGRQSTDDKDRRQAAELLDLMDVCGLTNLSIVPTRQDNIIDLLMTNDEDNINYKSTVVNKKLSDHNLILFNMNMVKTLKSEKKMKHFNYTMGLLM